MTRDEVAQLLANQAKARSRSKPPPPRERRPATPAQQTLVRLDQSLERGALSLVLPLPPSWNRVFKARAVRIGGRWTGHVYKSAEAKAYAKDVAERCAAARIVPFPKGVMLRFSAVVAMERAGCDLDDRLKVYLDALNGSVFEDDEQVAVIGEVVRIVDPKDPGVRATFEVIDVDRYGNPK